MAQKLAASRAPVNWRRTAAMVAYGGLWSGPSMHFWQLFVERVFRGGQAQGQLWKKVRRPRRGSAPGVGLCGQHRGVPAL